MFCVIMYTDTYRQTDRRTNFLLQILTPRGQKRREKSFSLIEKKVDIDPIAIHVRGGAFGRIIDNDQIIIINPIT